MTSKGRPAVGASDPFASYCRNYNIIDSIVIIDCSSSCPSRCALFESGLSTVHEPEMARIYGFTERIRAILSRHVHTPQIALFVPICVTFELILKHCFFHKSRTIIYLATISPKVSPRGLTLRRHHLVVYLQLFITSFFHTSREHDTGVIHVRVYVYV